MSFSIALLIFFLLFCSFQLTYFVLEMKDACVKARDTFLALEYITLTLCMSVLYYHVFCIRHVDADRMYNEMEIALHRGGDYLFELYNLNPLSAVLIFLPALAGLPYLIKSIAALVYFGSIFLFAWKMRKKYSSISIFLSVLFLLCALDLSYPADTVRFPTACMLFCSSLIFNKYGNLSKRDTVVLMVVACLLHVSLWPFLLLFAIINFLKNNAFIWLCILCLIYFPLVVSFTDIVTRINPSLGWKLQLYFEIDGQYYESLISKEQFLFLLFIYIFCISLLLYGLRKEYIGYDLYAKCFIVFSSMIFGSMPSNVIFPRYVPILVIMSFPFVSTIFSKYTSVIGQEGGKPKGQSMHFIFIAFPFVI